MTTKKMFLTDLLLLTKKKVSYKAPSADKKKVSDEDSSNYEEDVSYGSPSANKKKVSYEAPSDDQEDVSYRSPAADKENPTTKPCKGESCKETTRQEHKEKCIQKHGKTGRKPHHGVSEKKPSNEEKKPSSEEKVEKTETKKDQVKAKKDGGEVSYEPKEKADQLNNGASGKLFSGSFILAVVVVVLV